MAATVNTYCSACGNHHDLLLEFEDSFEPGRYEYICPTTRFKIHMDAPTESPQVVQHKPAGAVIIKKKSL